MATAQFPLIHYPGVDVVLVYDDVTLTASAIQATNISVSDCFITITSVANSVLSRSGTLHAGQQGTINVDGVVSLIRAVLAPSPTPSAALVGWIISSRCPA